MKVILLVLGLVCALSVAEEPKSHALIREHLSQGWFLPKSLQQKDLTTTVTLRIDRNGKVKSRRLSKPSGSPAFDAFILSAIDQARPLRKPPAEVVEKEISVEFRSK